MSQTLATPGANTKLLFKFGSQEWYFSPVFFGWIPLQRKGDTDNWNSKPKCPQSKAHTKAQAGNVILAIQQGGNSHEEVEDYGNLVEGHKEKEAAAKSNENQLDFVVGCQTIWSHQFIPIVQH